MSAPTPAAEMRQAARDLYAVRACGLGHDPLPPAMSTSDWVRLRDIPPDLLLHLGRWLEQAADALEDVDVPADEPALVTARAVLGTEGAQR